MITELDTQPVGAPVQRFKCGLAGPPSHGSGPGWLATPSLYDSFIRYSTPVYPGAIVAVGIAVARYPPHRPVRALLAHTVLTSD